jgi:hypothetical protein
MRRQLLRFEFKCDRCGSVEAIETPDAHASLPPGWGFKRDPTEHWIASPADYCPKCNVDELGD